MDFVVNAEVITKAREFFLKDDKDAASIFKIETERKTRRADFFASWKKAGVEPKHFGAVIKKDQSNFHQAFRDFIVKLAPALTGIKIGREVVYMNDAQLAEYNDHKLGAAHLILGRQKANIKGEKEVTNWQSQISSKVSALKTQYEMYLADEKVKEVVEPATGTKRNQKSNEEYVLDFLNKLYARSYKEGFNAVDLEVYRSTIKATAKAMTGKEGQIVLKAK